MSEENFSLDGVASRVADSGLHLALGRHVDERREVDQRHGGEHGHGHAHAQRAADHPLRPLHPHRDVVVVPSNYPYRVGIRNQPFTFSHLASPLYRELQLQ